MNNIETIQLGEIDFYGEMATAFREIHEDGEWKFVIMVDNERIVLLSY